MASSSVTAPFPLPKSTEKELLSLRNLLHLVYHRNKNQHRHSLWFRSLDELRRELRKLLAEIGVEDDGLELKSTREENVKKIDKRKRFEQLTAERLKREEGLSRAKLRMEFWTNRNVPKWFSAFSQLQASNRFAQIGLVLLAALARICNLLAITTAYEQLIEEDERLGIEIPGATGILHDLETTTMAAKIHPAEDTEDLGEVVIREDEDMVEAAPVEFGEYEAESDQHGIGSGPQNGATSEMMTQQPQNAYDTQRQKAPARKKKSSSKKRINAIDDIFGGFG